MSQSREGGNESLDKRVLLSSLSAHMTALDILQSSGVTIT